MKFFYLPLFLQLAVQRIISHLTDAHETITRMLAKIINDLGNIFLFFFCFICFI